MRTLIVLAIAFLCACRSLPTTGAASSDVTLDVEPNTAVAGGSVVLTLRNGSSGALGYNLCTSMLERRTSDDWQPVPSDRVCTMELRTLAPGAQARFTMDVPRGLAPGGYRYRTTVEMLDADARRDIRSDPFVVRS